MTGRRLIGRVPVFLGLVWLAAAQPALAQSAVSFSAATLYDNGSDTTGIAVADVNKDGHLDLIVAACDSGIVRVRFGVGDGTFQEPGSDYPAGPDGETSVFGLAVADFNGDGWPDIATGNVFDDTLVILLNDGTGHFGAPTPMATGGVSLQAIVAGSFNGDANVDLAIVNAGSEDVTVLLGNGDGTFVAAAGSPFLVGHFPYTIRAADVNGDTRLDLIVPNAASDTLTILLADGGGHFTPAADVSLDPGAVPVDVAIVDFDGNGTPDLVVLALGVEQLLPYSGVGDGTFSAVTPATPLATGAVPNALQTGDFNNDGFVDIVVANRFDDSVSVFLGNGTDFTPGDAFTTEVTASPVLLAAGDFNEDTRLDLAAGHEASNNTAILLNDTCCLVRVTLNGTGSGTVTSVPPGVDCGVTCSHLFPGATPIELTATPAPGSLFAGWSGACTGTGPCSLPPDADAVVTATFDVLALNPGFPDTFVGAFYSVAATTTNGAPPFTFTLTSGTLPPGLTLMDDGTIVGVPFQAGAYSFTLGVTDSGGAAGSGSFAISVAVGPTTTASPDVTVPYRDTPQTIDLIASVVNPAEVDGGTVTFTVRDSSSTIIGAPVTSGPVIEGLAIATYTLPAAVTPQTLTITVEYGGTPNFAASSTTASLVIDLASTVTVASSATAAFNTADQAVALSASVTSPGSTVDAGTVTFTVRDGSSAIIGAPVTGTVTDGIASAAYTLPGGTAPQTLTVIADYNGSANFSISSDATATLLVTAASTITAAANATATFNTAPQSVPLSAIVTSAGGTVSEGTVTFTVRDAGNAVIGAPVTSGTVASGAASASYTLPGGTSAQTLTITAVYNAATNFATSTDATHTLTVGAASTIVAGVDQTVTYRTSAQTVPLTATVTSPGGVVNEGTVTFTVRSGSVVIGSPAVSGTVSAGVANATYTLPGGTPAGALTITAVYSGSSNFTGSTDATHTLTISVAASTTTAFSKTVTFNTAPQTVALSAAIASTAGSVNAGTVTFTLRDAGSAIVGAPATSVVFNGSAVGTYSIPGGVNAQTLQLTVVYSGTSDITGSSDTTHTVTVSPAPTTTTPAAMSVVTSPLPQALTLSASISSTAGTVGTGTVIFSVRTVSNVTVGANVTGPVAAGTAQASYTLPGGTAPQALTIVASYGGTPNLIGSNGTATLNVTTCGFIAVGPSTMPPVRLGQPFTMTFTAPGVTGATFALAGPLPPGLTQSGDTVSGTPTALGRFDVNVDASSTTSSCTASGTFAFRVMRSPFFAVGPGGGSTPNVRGFDDHGTMTHDFLADAASFAGGVRVAMADINGDGIADIITAPGPGAPAATVRVFDGANGAVLRLFNAYPFAPAGGMYVAAGDVNGDGVPDIITGRDGATAEVRVFDGQTSALLSVFLAYPIGVNGVRVAAGDVDADGIAEIITAPPFGFGPEVRVFSAAGALRSSFLAYNPAWIAGMFVAAGDIDGDGRADIVTGADAGGGPHVIAFSGADGHVLHSFFAYTPAFPSGVRVAVGDVNLDGHADIITGAGPGGGPHVRVFDGVTGGELTGLFAYNSDYPGGTYVAAPIAQSRMAVEAPGSSSTISGAFQVRGWAALPGSATDAGVDTIHVWAVPVSGGPALFVGVPIVGLSRSDVGAVLGGVYADSGFSLMVETPPPPGTYDFWVFAHSSISGTFTTWRIARSVTISP